MYEKYKLIFEDYVKNYDKNDEDISYKIKHSYRVAKLCIEIAKSLQLSDKVDIIQYWKIEVDGEYNLNENIVKNIYERKCCSEKATNEFEQILYVICFLFDINYKYSFKVIKQNKSIDKRLNIIENHCIEDVTEIRRIVNNYIENNI